MPHRPHFQVRRILCSGLAAVGLVGVALADDDQQASRVPLSPTYRQECAGCHVAYPPALLPAASWRRIVSDLPHHFGTDASLEPALARELSVWLVANAGSTRRSHDAPPEDRITRSAWFVREHREVPAATWRQPAVKSSANCAACHTRADQGEFSEHDIRIPR